MIRITLISDTHGFLDPALAPYFKDCDEIWHAGDIGSIEVLDDLKSYGKLVRAVYGNIDGQTIRLEVPGEMSWEAEGLNIFMLHIGGYPGHYARGIKARLIEIKPDVFICGHSHILKVIYDKQLNMLHLNPGSCGREGFHKVKTLLRFAIEDGRVKEMAVVELGMR